MMNKEIETRSYHPLRRRELIACMIWGIDMKETEDISFWR